ncbi:homeobox domain-containing protein [Encephalitozoon intestinalis ATCC 50506]|uniref:Homeobox domain-containing protein n=1 Tax=Encephalitozoon intestinalis (strain ATCC 50506) TaxID=876142 RepID=E0S661_ENCIT|nr:homeobox domain-containing protein [Encephalitozoon intestinalis ATCC 50506]ADM11196.1 homeobox domain-containing protein [Encephalitozoon intestinalis ATCC 50506]
MEVQAALGMILLFHPERCLKKPGEKVRKSKFQKEVLKKIYQATPYPTWENKIDIGILISLSPRAVDIWFQNKRHISKGKNQSIDENADSKAIDLWEIMSIVKNTPRY